MHSNVVKSKCLQDCRLELIGHQGIESNEKVDKCDVIVSLLDEITADNIIQTTLITAAKKWLEVITWVSAIDICIKTTLKVVRRKWFL